MSSTIPSPHIKRSHCPVNFALEIFGDSWSLLIVRDMLLFGKTGYAEFLSSGEKVATNILAQRLEKLAAWGIVERKMSASRKQRGKYRLTKKGRDLYPVLREMMLWSTKYDPATDLPPELARVLKTQTANEFIEQVQLAAGGK